MVVDRPSDAHEGPLQRRMLALVQTRRPLATGQQVAVGRRRNEDSDGITVVTLSVEAQDPLGPDRCRSDLDRASIAAGGDSTARQALVDHDDLVIEERIE